MLQFVLVWGLDRGPRLWETSQHIAASSLVCVGQRSPQKTSEQRSAVCARRTRKQREKQEAGITSSYEEHVKDLNSISRWPGRMRHERHLKSILRPCLCLDIPPLKDLKSISSEALG